MKAALVRAMRPFATLAKWTGLAFVFARFHGTWLGLTVVLLLAFLLFRVDRMMWRFATGKLPS